MERNKYNYLFSFLIILIFFIVLHFFKITAPIENYITKAFNFVGQKVNFSRNFLNDFGRKKFCKNEEEIKKLDDINKKLTIENSELKVAWLENQDLKKQLNFFVNNQREYVVAHVIGYSGEIGNNNLIIDKGSNDKIIDGLAVIADNGIMIGKIASCQPTFCNVIIINDNKCKTASLILNTNKIMGITRGSFNLGLEMEMIPLNEKININDLVVTSGLEQKIPQGLVIGTVGEIITQPNDLFQKAQIKSLINYENLTIVSVIIR